jgi:Fe-S-cluster containining protein
MHGQPPGLLQRVLRVIRNSLPSIYLKFFPESILDFAIEEKKATCDKCALSEGRSPDHRSYKPNLKCCTFHPFQTNYLMGQILLSPNTPKEVLERIRAKIEKREYALPIGIVAPMPHQIKFAQRKDHEFGNREDWLCPYYDRIKNNCGIWKSRSSVCTSFHCLSSYGSAGFEFWDQLSDYISYVEMALMEEALLQLEFTPMEISDQLSFLNPEGQSSSRKRKQFLTKEFTSKVWKNYFEDQEGFYKKCYEIVANFSEKQFKKALGNPGIVIQNKLMTAKNAVIL